MPEYRVMLVDDHAVVREGLRALIERRSDLSVVAEAENGRVALSLARRHAPDLVIMDISMPELNGIDATRELLELSPKSRVLALSMHAKKHYVKGVLDAGAKGYVLKNCIGEEIHSAIEQVLAGHVYISPQLADAVFNAFVTEMTDTPQDAKTLSPRERQVLQLIAEGATTKLIATELHLSPRTVDMHRAKLMRKLKAESLADLIKYAIREGITSLE